jgi:inosose dehydratase
MDRDRVMSEMVDAGLHATELGPDGYLPLDADELTDYVGGYGLQIVGAFVPAILYRPDLLDDQLAYADRAAHQLAAAGSKVLVLGPATAQDGYNQSLELTDDEWDAWFGNMDRLVDVVGGHGLATAVHPHWGMVIERPEHIERMLESCEAGICLDTGHVFLGGGDPVALARDAAARVDHVHLKDVDPGLAEKVLAGDISFRDATVADMFTPLGSGSVDIAGVIRHLEAAGYQGWYVLEQDKALAVDPAEGEGPYADAVASVEFLRHLAATL